MKMQPVKIGKDGRCLCDCGTPCPLHRTGSEVRCTAKELIAAGFPVDWIEGDYCHSCHSQDLSERIYPTAMETTYAVIDVDIPTIHCNACGYEWTGHEGEKARTLAMFRWEKQHGLKRLFFASKEEEGWWKEVENESHDGHPKIRTYSVSQWLEKVYGKPLEDWLTLAALVFGGLAVLVFFVGK